MDIPFYKNGLRFSCQSCGKCCRISDGVVYLSEKDIIQLVDELSISREDFLQQYTHREHQNQVLNDFPNGDCIFFREARGCIIYRVRPAQCRTFPFWHSNLISLSAWEESAAECPGFNTGRLYTAEEIESVLNGEMDVDG